MCNEKHEMSELDKKALEIVKTCDTPAEYFVEAFIEASKFKDSWGMSKSKRRRRKSKEA